MNCSNTVKDCCSKCYRNKTCVGNNWFCKSCKKDKDTCSFTNSKEHK